MTATARVAVLATICCAGVFATEDSAIILMDGTRIAVTDHEIKDGRVRYFSRERGQWEFLPEDIVDWERTDAHNERVEEVAERRSAEERRERMAERRARTELHAVPLDDGVYYLWEQSPLVLEQATLELGSSKKRTVLNVISPVPVIPGKRTFSIEGVTSKFVTSDVRPVFYMRLDRFSRFGIARTKVEGDRKRRIVQQIYTVPKSEEQYEDEDQVDVFRQQMAPLVYKIWPVEPLDSGEYAIVEYTPGESNLRAWDFSHRPPPSAGAE